MKKAKTMKTDTKTLLREFEPEIKRGLQAVGGALMILFAVTMACAVVFLSGCYDGAAYVEDQSTANPETPVTEDDGDDAEPDDDAPERECIEVECPLPEIPEPDLSRCWLTQRVFFTVLPGENRIGWPDWECQRSGIEIAECWFHVSSATPDTIGYKCEFECGLWREVEIEWPAPYGVTEVALHNPCLIDGDLPLAGAVPLPEDGTVRFDHSTFREAAEQ